MTQVRRAFVCGHKTKGVSDCNYRIFLITGEPDRIPQCPEHGPMVSQPNRPYNVGGSSDEPDEVKIVKRARELIEAEAKS